MVRLKDESLAKEYHNILLFQFHYGTIKSDDGMPVTRSTVNFNSTMVRLKEKRRHLPAYAFAFQFHYGTIKSLG